MLKKDALIREKTEQAVNILKEMGIDCWITFTRESEICGDPTLVFLAPVALRVFHGQHQQGQHGEQRKADSHYHADGVCTRGRPGRQSSPPGRTHRFARRNMIRARGVRPGRFRFGG